MLGTLEEIVVSDREGCIVLRDAGLLRVLCHPHLSKQLAQSLAEKFGGECSLCKVSLTSRNVPLVLVLLDLELLNLGGSISSAVEVTAWLIWVV